MNKARALLIAPLQIAQAVVGLGAIAAFTRLMSADEFGRYALALSASMLAHTLVFTWAEAAAFRFYAAAEARGRLRDHFASLLAIAAALGVGVIALAAPLLAFAGMGDSTGAIAAFAAAAAVFRFLTRLGRETDRASFAIGRYATLETAQLVIGFGAGIGCLIWFDLGAAAPFAGLALAGALIALIDAPRLVARARGGRVSFGRGAAYASYGAPLALALAVELGVQTGVRIALAAIAGAASLGAYAAAFGLARPLDLMFMGAGAALSPLLLNAYEHKGVRAARRAARFNFTILTACAAPAAIGLALVAEPLAAFVVGEALSAAAAAALPWLALAGLFAGFNLYYWSEAFQLTKRTGERALIMLAPGAVQVALTLLLASAYGAAGAAAAALVGALSGTVLLAWLGRRRFPLPIVWSQLVRVGLACALMTGAVLAAPAAEDAFTLALTIAYAAGAYVIAAIALDVAGLRSHGARALGAALRKKGTADALA